MKHNLPNPQLKIVSKIVRTCGLFIFGVIVVFSAKTVFAQAQQLRVESAADPASNSIALTAIPPRTESIRLNPGETYQLTIKLKNISSTTQSIVSTARDFVIGDDGTTPIPISEQDAAPLRWSLASWMTVAPQVSEIAPNQTALFHIIIQVPADALPGGHYAMVTHQPVASGADARKLKQGGAASSIQSQVGTLVYVTVNGNIHEEAFIRNVRIPQWLEFGPVQMAYDIENLSDVHIAPQMKIEIKNFFGKTVETIAVESANIFPYSQRSFSALFDRTWGFGPYRAVITAAYGSEGKVAVASALFWMIPYRIILAVLVLFAALLASIIVIRRHVEHKHDIGTQHVEILEERIQELEKELKQKRG